MGNLNGPFKDIIYNFQEFKKSLGYKYDNINDYFELDNFLHENHITSFMATMKIFAIAVEQEENLSKKHRRYIALRELYSYLNILGYEIKIKEMHFKETSQFHPTILTTTEISKLFKDIDNISKLLNTKDKYIYPVLFRLIYSCGLRINEALCLKIADLSFKNWTITIRKSKNGKARMLPLSSSMIAAIKKYLSLVDNKTYLFESGNSHITYVKVLSFFHTVTSDIPNIRIHDLRHMFCHQAFDKLYKQRISEHTILFWLHIYMGHSNIESTEYYLKQTKETYKKILKVYKKNPTIIPKVGDIL